MMSGAKRTRFRLPSRNLAPRGVACRRFWLAASKGCGATVKCAPTVIEQSGGSRYMQKQRVLNTLVVNRLEGGVIHVDESEGVSEGGTVRLSARRAAPIQQEAADLMPDSIAVRLVDVAPQRGVRNTVSATGEGDSTGREASAGPGRMQGPRRRGSRRRASWGRTCPVSRDEDRSATLPVDSQLLGDSRTRSEPRKGGQDESRIGCAAGGGKQVTAISLGMPAVPTKLADRRVSRKIQVGKVAVGGDAQISVQSMTTTRTSDIGATLQQIAELTASGCDIVRVACPTQDDADALAVIAKKSQIPVIADIHFQPKYVFAAIDAGCAAVRVNPGNIKQFDDKVKEIAKAANETRTPIRIGVNAGSLDARLLKKYGKATPEALVESALWEASLFEEHGFGDIKISVKHNDPVVMVNAYRQLAAACDYPLHLGVTEAGPAFQGTIKSAVAFGALLSEGIGDTIRVSLSAPPAEEVKVGIQILESLNLKPRRLEIVSCPSCGRAQVDVYKLAEEVTAGLEGMEVPLRVAVMGCVVNGPGEAREADLGVASGNGKGQIFVKGEVIKTVPESKIVETLIEEAMKIAEQTQAARVPAAPADGCRQGAPCDPRGGAARSDTIPRPCGQSKTPENSAGA